MTYRNIVVLLAIMSAASAIQADKANNGAPTLAELSNGGTEWVLAHMNCDQPLPEGAEVTLAFVDGRVAGKSACNRYSAGIEEGESAGDIVIGPAMGTRMACPDHLMETEREYLDALAQVTNLSFQTGSLVLSGQRKDGSHFKMLFSQAGKDVPEEATD